MKSLIIYIHGKGGNSEEADHYKPLCKDMDIIGFNYLSENPWEAQREFSDFYDLYSKEYDSITLIANSIGAFFALSSLSDKQIDKALLISPIVDMFKLICDMMMRGNVSEKELFERKEIVTDFGETLSWEYLSYVQKYPIKWNIPTYILYGERDNLTSFETMNKFAKEINATITVMPNGEHWFHTDEQMAFLDSWVRKSICDKI